MLVATDTLRRMTPELASALTGALFAGLRHGRKRMAVWISNSDESGTGDPLGKFLVGGYYASEDYWRDFAGEWQRKVLDGPPLIPYLHMNEIRREEWRKKHNISDNDAQRRVSEAVLLLSGADKPILGTSVILRADLHDIVHRKSKEYRKKPHIGIDEPDYFCFVAYAKTAIAYINARHPEVKEVDFVVAKKGKLTDRLKYFHEEVKRLLDPPLSDLVGELIPATMETRLPLQAADIVLWHMQRFYANTMDTTDERRLNVLMKDTDGIPHEWKRSDLERFTDSLFKRLD
jgi:hypothetical protein